MPVLPVEIHQSKDFPEGTLYGPPAGHLSIERICDRLRNEFKREPVVIQFRSQVFAMMQEEDKQNDGLS
jgi:hypothetical protein